MTHPPSTQAHFSPHAALAELNRRMSGVTVPYDPASLVGTFRDRECRDLERAAVDQAIQKLAYADDERAVVAVLNTLTYTTSSRPVEPRLSARDQDILSEVRRLLHWTEPQPPAVQRPRYSSGDPVRSSWGDDGNSRDLSGTAWGGGGSPRDLSGTGWSRGQ